MEGECKIEFGSAHFAKWCTTHTSLLETCQFRRIAALEAEVRRLREALNTISIDSAWHHFVCDTLKDSSEPRT